MSQGIRLVPGIEMTVPLLLDEQQWHGSTSGGTHSFLQAVGCLA